MRTSAAMLATGLVLAACGTADDAAPVTEPVVVTAPATAGNDDLSQNEGSSTAGTAAVDATQPNDAATDPSTPADPAEAEAVTTDPAPDADVSVTDAPTAPPAPVEAVLGGRAIASELAAESDFPENYLPDLQVDDIRSGQKVNLRNVFPAERPVLIWAWAPH